MTHSTSKRFILNVIGKALVLLIVFHFLFIYINFPDIGDISLYNFFFPGRERFPFGENPSKSNNLTINDLNAMFASLRLDKAAKPNDEYRIFIFGDSSVWGSLLANDETLTGQLNQMGLSTCRGKKIHTYNLGYPTLSILKDLVFMDRSLKYNPDLILWLTTLESFPKENQVFSDLLNNNAELVQQILQKYNLDKEFKFQTSSANEHNFINQRRNIADLFRLQAYGVLWSATGIDQDLISPFTPAKRDFEEDNSFHGGGERPLSLELSFNVIEKAESVIKVPIVVINEPILISLGKNSDIRYNFYYPRWAFDQFRESIKQLLTEKKIPYYDFFQLVPENLFTNSAIHMNKQGVQILANNIKTIIISYQCN